MPEGRNMGILDEADDLVMAHAAGLLSPAQSLVVATQAELRRDVRRQVSDCEAIAGALMEDCEPAALSQGLRESVMAALDAPEAAPQVAPSGPRPPGDQRVPAPLWDYVGSDLEALPWRWVMPGLRDCILPLGTSAERTRLMWVKPGTKVPAHTHRGLEMTLVLQGAYADSSGVYRAGDLQLADESVDHYPVAQVGDACLCLVVTAAPIRLTGRIGQLFNRFVRY
ncbi:MAG: anti-sigma-E factor ChrR [Rhodospirillales bacterium]